MGRARGSSSKLHGKFESVYGTPPSRQLHPAAVRVVEHRPRTRADRKRPAGPGPRRLRPDAGRRQQRRRHCRAGRRSQLRPLAEAADRRADRCAEFRACSITRSRLARRALPSMSLEVAMPEVPSFEMNYGMRANTMKIDLSRRGLLNATIGLIGKGAAAPAGTTAAGTPTSVDVERFAQATGEIKKDGTRWLRSSPRRSLIRTISTRSKPSAPTAKSKTPTRAWRPRRATSPCASATCAADRRDQPRPVSN
jgi:hypothetical protein